MRHHRSWIASVALLSAFGITACSDGDEPASTTPNGQVNPDGGADARDDGAATDGGSDASNADGGEDAASTDASTDAASTDASGDAEGADADAGAPGSSWVKVFDHAGATTYVTDVGVDAAGNTYAGGWFNGTVDFGDGAGERTAFNSDAFVLKLDPSGNVLWVKVLAVSGGNERIAGVSVSPDGHVAFTGTYNVTLDWGGGTFPMGGNGQAFVAVADADGNPVWGRGFGAGGNADEGHAVSIDAAGEIAVVGMFQQTVDFGGGDLVAINDRDAFVAVYDATGAHKASRRLGTSQADGESYAHAVRLRDDGEVYVVGGFKGTSVLGTPPLESTTTDLSDAYAARLGAADLTTVWAKRFGGLGTTAAVDLALAPNDDLVITGSFTQGVDFGGGELTSASSEDIFLLRLDADGGHVWSKRFGGNGGQYGVSVDVAATSGDLVLTGWIGSETDFGGGAISAGSVQLGYYARFAGDGAHLASYGLGTAGHYSYGRGIAVDLDGAARVGGTFSNTLELLGQSFDLQGDEAAFVARLPKP